MKGKRYSTEEKVRILRDVDAGRSIVDICREKNISDVTYHRWRKQFGHMNLNEARRLKELERENTELKKMLADSMPKGGLRRAMDPATRARQSQCQLKTGECENPYQSPRGFRVIARKPAGGGGVWVCGDEGPNLPKLGVSGRSISLRLEE